jgi:predicted transcriptional regulator
MTVHLTPAQEQRLEYLAAQTARSADELAQEAIDKFLNYREALIAAVREGEESAQQDGWLNHEEVIDRINKRLPKTA